MRTKYRALLWGFYGRWFPHKLSILSMLWLSMVTSQYCHTGFVFYIAGSALYLNITDCMVDLWLLRYECFYTVHTYMKIQCIFHPLYNCIICFGRCTLYMHTNGIWLDLMTSSMTAQFGAVVLLPVVMSCRIVCRTQAQVPAPYEVWWGHNYDKLYTCVRL